MQAFLNSKVAFHLQPTSPCRYNRKDFFLKISEKQLVSKDIPGYKKQTRTSLTFQKRFRHHSPRSDLSDVSLPSSNDTNMEGSSTFLFLSKLSSTLASVFPIWVIAASICGYLKPNLFSWIKGNVMVVALAITMLGKLFPPLMQQIPPSPSFPPLFPPHFPLVFPLLAQNLTSVQFLLFHFDSPQIPQIFPRNGHHTFPGGYKRGRFNAKGTFCWCTSAVHCTVFPFPNFPISPIIP